MEISEYAMRINFSKFSSSKSTKWIIALVRQFAEEYDIKSGKVTEYVATPPGARAFVAYLKSEGFKVEYWCLEPLTTRGSYNNAKITEYIAFGLKFDEACPKFIEIKLKHSN